jgi:hypothetical protein
MPFAFVIVLSFYVSALLNSNLLYYRNYFEHVRKQNAYSWSAD